MKQNMRPLSLLALTAASLLLSGCFRYENDPGEGGVTIGEARELDEIAADLDARPQAPGVSLGNASDDNSMTGAVVDEQQDVPVPANPAAIKDKAPSPLQPAVGTGESKAPPPATPIASPSPKTDKRNDPQGAKTVANEQPATQEKELPLKKGEPKPARPKPVPVKPVPAKNDNKAQPATTSTPAPVK